MRKRLLGFEREKREVSLVDAFLLIDMDRLVLPGLALHQLPSLYYE